MPNIENSKKFADKFKLKSTRLKNWDYSSSGYYFITIKTLNDNKFFGKIIDEKLELSKIGGIVKQELLITFEIRKSIKLVEWIIMPNHIHLIIEIIKQNNNCRDVLQNVSTNIPFCVSIKQSIVSTKYTSIDINNTSINIKNNFSVISPKSDSISNIIKQFKSSVKRNCNQQNLFFAWQTRFYDHVIQSEKELNNTRQYIKNNPKNWDK